MSVGSLLEIIEVNNDLDNLTELARLATRKKLEELKRGGCLISESIKSKLVMEVHFDNSDRVFELVLPGDSPEDAKVFTSVRGNLATKELQDVIVNLDFFEMNK